jgi:hypothetical protein
MFAHDSVSTSSASFASSKYANQEWPLLHAPRPPRSKDNRVATIPYPFVWVFTVQAELADHHVSQAETSARMLLEPQAIFFFNAFDGAH